MSVDGEIDNENAPHGGHEPHLTDEVDNEDNGDEHETEAGHATKETRTRNDSHSDDNTTGNGHTANGGGSGAVGVGAGGGTAGATNGQTNTNDPKNKGKMEQNEKAKLQVLREVFAEASKSGRLNKKMLPPSVCRGECMKLWRQLLTTDAYKGIRVVRLRWCAIQSPGAKVLADGLINSCMDSLEILDLMGNEIGVSGTRAIAGLLAPGIDLDSFQVTDVRSVLAGFEGRERIGCLKTLNLAYNCTSDAGCGYLGKAICISNTIKRLSLENCEISDNGCKYLRRGIERNNTITHLNISANRFGDLGAREIQTFLLRNNSLQYLDISRNRLGAQRTMDIAKGLTMNHSLKKLRMNINRTGARGAQVLAKMLINNHTLEELELSYNEIFNDGVQVLAQGLIQNHGLKKLVLWYNGLEDAAARQLARALSQRSKQPHFRNDMVQAVAESQSDIFFISDISGKLRPHPDTYPICEKIIDYVPIFMFFEVDLSHNRRITKNGFTTLLDVANSENICIQGLKELLSKDKKERESPGQGKSSLY